MSDIMAELAEARRGKNLSQSDVARLTGVQQSTISDWETGTTANPRLSTVQKLAAVYGYELVLVPAPATEEEKL